jgi:hypothetical protein
MHAALLRRLLPGLLVLALGPCFAQPPVKPLPAIRPGKMPRPPRQVFVLFPHSRDAQRITVVEDEDGELLYQGDIRIDTSIIVHDPAGRGLRPVDERLRYLRAMGQQRHVTYSGAAALWWGMGKWDNGIVPYSFSSNMPQGHRDMIARAAQHISSRTHLCIRPREGGEDDYIAFVAVRDKIYSGQSALGKQGGRQPIYIDIADNKGEPSGMFDVVVHEILHALGMIHEQSRSDRDEHVRILWDNINDSARHNFEKDGFSQNFGAYDPTSIMHYHRNAFGTPGRDSNPRVTIEPVDARRRIAPMRELSPGDIAGLNELYAETDDCRDRPYRIRAHALTPEGRPGPVVYDSIVSAGWSDAATLHSGSTTADYMMFLNRNTSQAVVKRLRTDGAFDRIVYAKRWTPGWTHLETTTIGGTPYILHYKKPYLSPLAGLPYGLAMSDTSGTAVIARVDGRPAFADKTLGTQPYRADWGTGWDVIRFFSAGGGHFLFRLNERTNRAQIFRIDAQQPFAGNSLGRPVYDKVWTDGWTDVRFYRISGKTYALHLKSESGLMRIAEVDEQAPFADNNLGVLRYEGQTDRGWTSVDVHTTLQGRTLLFLGNRSTGDVNICEFRAQDPFQAGTPYTVVYRDRWTRGWTYAGFYRAGGGDRLLIMKR